MNVFYIELYNGLQGCFVKAQASCKEEVIAHATKYMGLMWRDVHSDAYFHEVLRRRYPNSTKVINRDRPIIID